MPLLRIVRPRGPRLTRAIDLVMRGILASRLFNTCTRVYHDLLDILSLSTGSAMTHSHMLHWVSFCTATSLSNQLDTGSRQPGKLLTRSLELLTDCSCGSSKCRPLCSAAASMLREIKNGLLTGTVAAPKARGESPAAVRRISPAGSVPVMGLRRPVEPRLWTQTMRLNEGRSAADSGLFLEMGLTVSKPDQGVTRGVSLSTDRVRARARARARVKARTRVTQHFMYAHVHALAPA